MTGERGRGNVGTPNRRDPVRPTCYIHLAKRDGEPLTMRVAKPESPKEAVAMNSLTGIALGLGTLVCANAQAERVYVVSPNGDDPNPGSESQALRTISRAVSLARAGDTILLRDGVYRETVVLPFSGQEGSPITLRNYPDEHPVIEPAEKNQKPPGQGILLQASEGWQKPIGWITVEGLEIRYAWDGVKIYNAHDVVVRSCRILDNWNQGILGNGNRVLIEANVIAGNGTNPEARPNQVHGIYATGSDFTIRNNVIHSNTAYGIQVAAYAYKADSHASPEYADARNWLITNNTFAFNKNRSGIVIWMAGVENCVVQNNIFYKNGASNGIDFYDQEGHQHTIRSNIFFPVGKNLSSSDPDAYRSIDNRESDPGFVDAERGDFRLRADSPAIDCGTADRAPSADIEGKTRPQGKGVDIGAYEFPE